MQYAVKWHFFDLKKTFLCANWGLQEDRPPSQNLWVSNSEEWKKVYKVDPDYVQYKMVNAILLSNINEKKKDFYRVAGVWCHKLLEIQC